MRKADRVLHSTPQYYGLHCAGGMAVGSHGGVGFRSVSQPQWAALHCMAPALTRHWCGTGTGTGPALKWHWRGAGVAWDGIALALHWRGMARRAVLRRTFRTHFGSGHTPQRFGSMTALEQPSLCCAVRTVRVLAVRFG